VPSTTPEPPQAIECPLAAEVVRLTNIAREKEGLKPLLVGSPELFAAALKRAQEIVVHWSHDRPDGTAWHTVFAEFSVRRRSSGENLAKWQSTPVQAVNDWLDSPGHRANIMRDDYTHIGVGVVRDNGRLYWVQLFITV